MSRAAGRTKSPMTAIDHGLTEPASHERVSGRALGVLLWAAVAVLELLWWAPSLALAVVPGLALSWGVDLRLRHARRLAAAGRLDAALRIYAAVQRDIGADLRRTRGRRGAP